MNKIARLSLFLITLFSIFIDSKTNAQDLFISINGGASDLYVRDGYNIQNWGTNWGIGAVYMIKDSSFGLEIRGLAHIMRGPDYNNNAFIYPLMLKVDLDYNINLYLEAGAYYERFTQNPDGVFNKLNDAGAIVGLNLMYPISRTNKWFLGADFDVLHGYTKPITVSLPNTNGGSSATLTGSYNLLFLLMNLQIIYHIGY